jgi:hypothetical protein
LGRKHTAIGFGSNKPDDFSLRRVLKQKWDPDKGRAGTTENTHLQKKRINMLSKIAKVVIPATAFAIVALTMTNSTPEAFARGGHGGHGMHRGHRGFGHFRHRGYFGYGNYGWGGYGSYCEPTYGCCADYATVYPVVSSYGDGYGWGGGYRGNRYWGGRGFGGHRGFGGNRGSGGHRGGRR